jgi:asparagine synthase (glutamine-hydrolysing)
MCGIAGAVGVASIERVQAMSDAIAHRGPDDSGVFFDATTGVALGHRRLSIIDLSSCGHQPMPYMGGRYQLIYNGEIYNFAELRAELERAGHPFRSRSDSEVILAAYAEWGARCVERFRGMFAFAIYDRDEALLFLARDRFGIKPLYFTERNGVFAFASEVKALLAGGFAEPRLDRESLAHYLSLGAMPQPRTALADVRMLEPGHVLTVRRDGSFVAQRYWDIAEAAEPLREELRGIDRVEAARRLRALLEEATRLHMIADVPVGAFLSGGIDSTAVVGLMTRASGARIRTFSVGFSDDTTVADERRWARLSAESFGAEHTEVVVSGGEIAERFDEIVEAIDQPSLDGTNTFLVSRAAGSSLKVALSGLGGDELFGGYPHFARLRRAARWDRWLGGHRSLRRRALRRVPGRFLRERDFLVASKAERYGTLRQLAPASLAPSYAPLLRDELDPVAQTTYIEVERYLRDTLLRDADAMAMHSSLEVRPVLLDHVLAEFAFALPPSIKMDGATNKPVLVDAVRDLLPPALLQREKTGFELPLQSWLAGPLRERAIAAFSSDEARAVFSREILSTIVGELTAGRRPPLRVWAYLMLVEWMQRWSVTL